MQRARESPQSVIHLTKNHKKGETQGKGKKTKIPIRDKDQDSFPFFVSYYYCAAASNAKWRAQTGV